jgi:hypothetical protein
VPENVHEIAQLALSVLVRLSIQLRERFAHHSDHDQSGSDAGQLIPGVSPGGFTLCTNADLPVSHEDPEDQEDAN